VEGTVGLLSKLATLAVSALLVAGAAWPGQPPAALGVLVLAALLAALGRAGWRLAALALPGAGLATRGTAATVLATALAVVPATVLGHLGLLFPGPFLLWAAVLAAVTAFLPAPAPAEPAPLGPDRRPPPLRAAERGLAAAAVAVLVLVSVAHVRASRYSAPGAYGYDDISYHLTTVASWVKRGDLAMPKFAVGDDATVYYPIGGEILSWTLLSPFRTNDVAARWSQLPFALATLAAMAALAGRLGFPSRSMLPGLVLYWSLARVFPQLALGAGNDHSTAFFLLAACDGALELARRRTPGAGLYAGTALGLLLGTKYLGVLFVPLVAGVWLVARVTVGRTSGARGRFLLPELAAAGAAAVAGGFTYLRNLVTTGNPLFPAPLRVAGVELLAGWEHATIAWRRQLPEWQIDLPEFLWRGDLWGPVAPWALVTAALAAPAVALLLPRRDEAGTAGAGGVGRWLEAAVLALPAATFVLFLRLMHDHRDIRYFFGGVAVAAVGWGYLADRLERSGRRGGGALAAALRGATYAAAAVWVAFRPEPPLPDPRPWLWLLVGAVLGAAAAAGWGGLRRGLGAVARRPGRTAVAAALVLVPLAEHVAARYSERRLEHRLLPRYLEEHLVGPEGATVAYVGHNAPYLYFGSRLQNRVVIVPTRTRDLDRRLYTWGGTTAQPYRRGRAAVWIDNLERLGVSYVVVVRLGHEGPERLWMLRHPQRFRQVAAQGVEEVWRFES
jgi:hypothetical protein